MTATKASFSKETESKLATLAEWIQEAETVVWFTGAGISTESGLPDFRGPDGVWTRRDRGLPPPKPNRPWNEVAPNAAHLAIVEFEKLGRCAFLVSQNVDNLHLKSDYPFEKLAELHGNQKRLRCRPCEMTYAIGELRARINSQLQEAVNRRLCQPGVRRRLKHATPMGYSTIPIRTLVFYIDNSRSSR